ncbi:MAG TPA: hypothetical protein EYQ14_04950 [Gammaproteobacteria bacterium]|nr:hypothetical protein [Gammaproteobacteria bacterium]
MLIERLITFIVLGFFIFVADFSSWWQYSDLSEWYRNYLVWIGLIIICYIASTRLDASRLSADEETRQQQPPEPSSSEPPK